jgi:serine/threonine-protein kinase
VRTLAGSPSSSYADGPSSAASFNLPGDITVDMFGNVFVADTYNNRIRKIATSGNMHIARV